MTMTLIARNVFTRQIGVCIASGSDDCADGSLAICRSGILSLQAKGNAVLRNELSTLLDRGARAGELVSYVEANDAQHDLRQLMVMPWDGEPAAYTGAQCLKWAGDVVQDNLILAGNMLTGDDVLPAIEAAYLKDRHAHMHRRLFSALKAGMQAGGDMRGHRSAAILILGHHAMDIRINASDAPLIDLEQKILI